MQSQFARLFPSALRATCVAFALAVPPSTAFAIGGLGDIVYDPSNYLQAVKQVQAWEQQYRQMTQALAKAEAQVDAITGTRGFGEAVNNLALHAIIAADFDEALSTLNATGKLSGRALRIRAASTLYDCEDRSAPNARRTCLALLGQTAQLQAFQHDTMALLEQRTLQIDGLRAEINATDDAKGIAELQARLAAEQAQVDNDQTKIALANAMLAANRQAAAQAEAERLNALMATNKPSVLDSLSFMDLGIARRAQ